MVTQELGTYTPPVTYSGTVSVWDDPAGIGIGVSSGTNVTSFSVTQVVTYGSSCVVASVAVMRTGTFTGLTRSCTCGGTPMTFVGAQLNNNASGNGWVEMYVLNGVASGNQTITYTISSGAAISICSNAYPGVSSVTSPTNNWGNSGVISSGAITGSSVGDLVVSATSPPNGSAYVAPLSAFMYQAGGDQYGAAAGWCDAGLLESPGGGTVTNTSDIYGSSGVWGAVTVTLKQLSTGVTGVSVPANIAGVWVTLIGPGGGGAGGSFGGNVSAGISYGSGGGGGGGLVFRYIPVAQLGSTYSVSFAPGGAGGWFGNVYVVPTNGISAGNTAFSSGPTTLQAGGGVGGIVRTGTNNAAAGGFGDYPGGLGGLAAQSTASPPGGNGGSPLSGGAGGGGASCGSSGTTGGAGGNSSAFGIAGAAGGTSGTPMNPGSDSPGPVAFTPGAGAGAGAGNGSGTTIGARGGWGLGYGSGGGAGGIGNQSNGENGGLGGAGGPGFVGLVWDYR